MHSRRHPGFNFKSIALSLLLSFMAVAGGGCATSHKATQSNGSSAGKSVPETAPASTRPDNMDASAAETAELLALKAATYSKEMAPAIARHSAGAAATPTTPTLPAQPSIVQWGDPSASQLSLLPGYLLRSDSQPTPPAAVEATPSSANPALAQVASMKTSAIPNSGATITPETPAHDPAADNTAGHSADHAMDHTRLQIASLTPAPAPSETMQDAPAAHQSADAPPGSDQTLSALDAKMSKRVNEYPHDVSAHLDYQLLQFLMDEPVPNMQMISTLPDEDREMMSAVMDGLSNYRNNLRADNNMLLSHKVRPLLEMADRLRSLADLTIPTISLCREVRGFGTYTPFEGDPPHFSAGVDHPVILYCEVQNFASQLTDSRMWQTALVQDAVLYTEGGMSAWTDKTQTVNDTARNRRQDFFIVQKMVLPHTLPMGRYLLKVTIEDKQSHHVAEATEPLLIIAD